MSKVRYKEINGVLYPLTKAELVEGLASSNRTFELTIPNFGSHRGFCSEYPENTMPAFQGAIDRGYNLIETDLVQSSDGVQFCLHDATINRTSNGTGYASSLTSTQLLSYDFGYSAKFGTKFQGTKIPTLEELLIFCKRKNCFVELDLADDNRYANTYLQNTYNMVKQCNMLDRVIFCAKPARLSALKAIDSSVMMSVSAITSTSLMDSAMTLIADSRGANFSILYNNLNKSLVTYAHDLGVSVKTWYSEGDGNDTSAHANSLFNMGVETILTDFIEPNTFDF